MQCQRQFNGTPATALHRRLNRLAMEQARVQVHSLRGDEPRCPRQLQTFWVERIRALAKSLAEGRLRISSQLREQATEKIRGSGAQEKSGAGNDRSSFPTRGPQ